MPENNKHFVTLPLDIHVSPTAREDGQRYDLEILNARYIDAKIRN